jgi:broad specificity phosphatase PhoE/ribonuclease HI
VSSPALRVIVEADGGSRGNPGPAGYGAVVRDATDGQILLERAEGIGRVTNNVAEYRGLIAGLTAAAELSPAEVAVRMDSKLVVEQMSGRWRVKHPDLKPLYAQAHTLATSFASISFSWIPRERNKDADRLANAAMDAAVSGKQWEQSTVERADPAKQQASGAGTSTGWSAPAGEPTTTILLRHGQTEHSIQRRFSGRGDLPLTETGQAQAKAAAGWLAGRGDIAAIVSSPLRRAMETAQVVAAATGAPLSFDEDLTECDFGAWEGLTFAEVAQRWPDELAAWSGSAGVAPPGGESFAAVARRVGKARDRLLERHPAARVVVVSHVTPIKTLLRLALEAPSSVLYRLHLDVASVSTVDWFPDGPASVRTVNSTGHLEP